MKIAQMIPTYSIHKNYVSIEESEELTETERGIGGFGSTGI